MIFMQEKGLKLSHSGATALVRKQTSADNNNSSILL